MEKSIQDALRCFGKGCNKKCQFYTDFNVPQMPVAHCKRQVIENMAADIIDAAFFSIRMIAFTKKDGDDIVRYILENFGKAEAGL